MMSDDALCDVAPVQEPNFSLGTPARVPIFTTKTLLLKLKKLPEKARRAFRVGDAPHNLVAVAELADAGCGTYFHRTGFDIDYNGEIIYRGWRCPKTRLWKMSLEDDGTSRIVHAGYPRRQTIHN